VPPDFQRAVHVVLGLPFDALSQADAVQRIKAAIHARTRCFFSTPNLNFVVACLDDAEFRASVLQSDLSLADGWPIVAAARLLRIPLPERVAGSSVFSQLAEGPHDAPIRTYLFGGPEGAAQAACERLNEARSGVRCVGFDPAGFGSVEAMSDDARLQRLNAAAADLVVVSLGARKGQAWIRHNLARIEAPAISHLGAVVNFAAGTVRRAPPRMQAMRLEWLWRIKEEPALWRRYARDAAALLGLLCNSVVPLAVLLRARRPPQAALAAARASVDDGVDSTLIRLTGAWAGENLQPLRDLLDTRATRQKPIEVDLGGTTFIDSAVIGVLCLLHGWNLRLGSGRTVAAASPAVRRLLRWSRAGYLEGVHPAGSPVHAIEKCPESSRVR
jgi:N-acetylglucosaminyldiphosphoundecaprenol N-acetyl-beta-D-mannosaminyltransferase